MTFRVKPVPAEAKPAMTEVTHNAEYLRDAADEDAFPYLRIVTIGDQKFTYTSDYRKWKGEDVEIPIT